MRHDATLDELDLDDEITVWRHDGTGQGGVLRAVLADGVSIATPLGPMQFRYEEIARFDVYRPADPTECLDFERGDCAGPVEMWWPGSGHQCWPRCTKHGEERQARAETSMERYADSDVEPDWFDPTIAGERWSEDY